ncbi:MAG: tetratricopeptide repeat protein [Longimicrobiaceae bacterium]
MKIVNSRWGGLRPLPGLLAAALALPMAACNTDKLVDVKDPGRLPPEALDNAGAVPSLINGAVRQLYVAYSGAGDDGYIPVSGVFTDELYYGDTFTTRRALDIRTQQNPALGNQQDASFNRLQQARINSRRAYAAIQKFFPEDAENKSLMRTVEGYTYVTLGEGWCGNVPFSSVPETGAIDPTKIEHGTPLTTPQIFTQAVARFNEALALDPANRVAKIGKGRALLNNGDYAGAAAAVASVPTDWAFFIEHSANTGSQNNALYQLQSNGRYGVANDEGGPTTVAERPSGTAATDDGEGINYRSINDPRVPYTADFDRILGGPGTAVLGTTCFSSSVPCWYDNNDPNNDADIPLASGVEARLIEAEALLNAGDVAGWLGKLNGLRASVAPLLAVLRPDQKQVFPFPPALPSLPALADPGTFQSRLLLTMQERNLWMYLTGHRLGDLRRLVRNYGLAQSAVFPSGAFWRSGGTYGTNVAFLVPFNEQNNPNFNADQCNANAA